MWPPAVIKVEVSADRSAGLADAVVGSQINLLVFDAAPQPLDEDIVPPGALDIDEVVLPNLTAEDLRDLGVGSIGHRRKLLDAIALLRGDAEAKAKAPPPKAPSAPNSSQDTAERRQVTVMF